MFWLLPATGALLLMGWFDCVDGWNGQPHRVAPTDLIIVGGAVDGGYLLDGRGGVKTKFCPDVAGFCPRVAWNLSWSGRNLSACVRGTSGTGALWSGADVVKTGGCSGGVEALVELVPVLRQVSRARARFGTPYGSARAVPVQFVQCAAVFSSGSSVSFSWSI